MWGSDSQTDSASAPDFGPYTQTTAATGQMSADFASASADQTSTTGTAAFGLQGHLTLQVSASGITTPSTTTSTGRTQYEFTFDVSAPTTFTITGTLDAAFAEPLPPFPDFEDLVATAELDDESTGGAQVFLFGVRTNTTLPLSSHTDVNWSGTLQPGRYAFGALARGNLGFPGGSLPYNDQGMAEYNLSVVATPEPGAVGLMALGAGVVVRRRRA